MAMLYVIVVLGGLYAEGYCCANDYEQAQGRVFQAIARIIEKSPLLKGSAKISSDKIEFTSMGSTIVALASHYASAAGANPNFITFDELWSSWNLMHPSSSMARRRACFRGVASF
jgi:phage terminase large subunit-like protein